MLFEQLYNDVLKSLPFSITGYGDAEGKLYSFYDKLSESLFIKQNRNIKFFFCSFPTLKSYSTWEITPLDYFYFKTYSYSRKDAVLSFYFYLLNKYCEGKSNAEILANLFAFDIDVQVKLSDYKYLLINFDKRDSILSIQIPKTIFKKEIINNLNWTKEFESKFKNNSNLPIKKYRPEYYLSGRYYKLDKGTQLSDTFVTKNNILPFNEDNFNTVKIQLEQEFNQHYKFMMVNSVESAWINRFTGGILAGSFLCLYYDCAFEYLLGCGKIEHRNNQEINRNLGGIVVGYSSDSNLSQTERAFFNVVSDRITSVISGQYLKDEYEKLSTPNLLEATSLCYGVGGIKEITHGSGSYFPISNTLTSCKSQISELHKIFEILDKTGKKLEGIDKLRTSHAAVLSTINTLTDYDGTLNSEIQTIRNQIEIKSSHIKTVIDDLECNGKIEFLSWDDECLSAFVNPVEILKDGINEMLKLIFDSVKGIGQEKCHYTIYSKIEREEVVDSTIHNHKKCLDNYIVFMHGDATKKLDPKNSPNWLDNLLRNNIRFVGDFFYSYLENEERKFFDIALKEQTFNSDSPLNEINTNLTKKLSCISQNLPIWYIFNFKTFKQ